MIVGIPREIKVRESRVGMVPAAVRELTARGHRVLVEHDAGAQAGFPDDMYLAAGAEVAADAAGVFSAAELLVKVKEPQPAERAMLRPGQMLFTYLHLAPDPEQTRELLASGATCIAYETVTAPGGRLPLLAPMSEVAGRMSIQVGAHFLEKPHGGAGVLLAGVPGTAPGRVVILGSGTVGTHAAAMAVGTGADVTVFGRNLESLRALWRQLGARVRAVHATSELIEQACVEADLVVGAVLVPGAAAPRLVGAHTVQAMKPGSVIVDVSIDQGGCVETARPTTHDDPVVVVDGVLHYGVTNMPGAVPRTSALALSAATLPFVLALAGHGPSALRADPHLRAGLNIHAGALTCLPVAEALGLPYTEAESALGT
ncbi:MAG: alanine dehydrogenase [Burkholderiales bacterium]|nr:MAG: alanine dehydrogenase [Burkholderiales bacterium]